MALTKITSRILDSSGVTILGTIATGVWQGTAINQTYLVGQSGTNTGDETLARINALDVTELGTISSGVWNGTAINQTYLVGQSGTNTGDQTTISGNAGTVTNGVYTTGNQTIGGVKTFSDVLTAQSLRTSTSNTGYNLISREGSGGVVLYVQGDTGGSLLDVRFGSTTAGGGTRAFQISGTGHSYFGGNVGIGTSGTPAYLLTASGTNLPYIASVTASVQTVMASDQTNLRAYIGTRTNHPIAFVVDGNEKMRIGSGGDLSTNDGTFTMHDVGGSPLAFKGKSSNGGSEIDWYANNGTTRIGYLEIAQTAASKLNIETANDFEIYTDSTKRLTIASGGDVGVGTTPNVAGATWRTLFIGSAGTIISRKASTGYETFFSSNYYINSSNVDTRRVVGGSSRMMLDGDVIKFQNAPTGAANASPSWSNRLTIGSNWASDLDAYEEGTWTPIVKFGGGSSGITYNGSAGSVAQGGHYTRIGRVVTFAMRIIMTSKGSSTGEATITGLPYTVANLPGNYGSAMYSFANNFVIPPSADITIDNNSSIIRLRYTQTNGNYGNVGNSDFNNNTDIILTGTYMA